jgi:flagellar hook-length control protein FliK
MVNPLVSILTGQIAPTGGAGAGVTAAAGGAGAATGVFAAQGGLLAGNPFIQLLLSQDAQAQIQNTEGGVTGQLISGLTQTELSGINTEGGVTGQLISGLTQTELSGISTDALTAQDTDALTAQDIDGINSAGGYGPAISQLIHTLNTQDATDGTLQANASPVSASTDALSALQSKPTQTGDATLNAEALQTEAEGFDPALAFTQSQRQSKADMGAHVATTRTDNENSRFDALKKAFKAFDTAESQASANTDKSALNRAVAAYGGGSEAGDFGASSENDGGLVGLTKQPTAQAGSSAADVFLNNLTHGGKVSEPLSSAVVAAKNPVPNSLSQNPTAAEQVSLRITKAVESGDSRITLTLDPADLGKVEIKLNLNHGDRHGFVQVTADRPETLQMLKGDSRILERALNDAGIQTNSGSLSFNLRGDGGGQAMQQQFADHQANQQRGFDSYGNVIALDAIEEMTTTREYRMNLADGMVDITV